MTGSRLMAISFGSRTGDDISSLPHEEWSLPICGPIKAGPSESRFVRGQSCRAGKGRGSVRLTSRRGLSSHLHPT